MENKRFHEIVNVLFLISWFIIILFTSTVLFVILRYWHSHCRSVVNLLMCNSSFALFFFAITYSLQTPSVIQQIYFDGSPPSALFCQISACLATFSTGLVAHSCIVQAIARFFITVLYQHKSLLTFRTTWMIIIISWLINVIIAVGLFLSPYAYQYDPESLFCMLTAHYFPTAISVSILFVFFTVFILIVLYVIILHYTIYQTRINPNSQSTLQARRNKRVFRNIIFTVSVHAVGGIPYICCLIMNVISEAPWPLYSIQVLSLSFISAVHSIFLFVKNKQVKEILFARLTGLSLNTTVATQKNNRITPYSINNRRKIQGLPTIT
ncbi:hypothetical protein I4U23_016002 [Adineta vaga]|nr:hypothetical protein I4U23_016002 [Adineta vaga]